MKNNIFYNYIKMQIIDLQIITSFYMRKNTDTPVLKIYLNFAKIN